jgi:hypothetical protein
VKYFESDKETNPGELTSTDSRVGEAVRIVKMHAGSS